MTLRCCKILYSSVQQGNSQAEVWLYYVYMFILSVQQMSRMLETG